MHNFQSYLQDLSLNTGIKFNIVTEDENTLYSGISKAQSSELIIKQLNLANLRASILLPKEFENCITLLKYTIENKYKEIFTQKEQLLVGILEEKNISQDKVDREFPFISKGSTLFLVTVDGSKYEALNIIRQLYSEGEVLSLVYGDNLIVLGVFEEINEHARSIRESIVSDLYCKCSVGYGNKIFNVRDIKKAFEEAKGCFILGKNFGIKDEIFFYDKMLFEKIVFNISDQVKLELLTKFKEKFNLFDSELINTIEEFINCGLNISDAARRLYVHRNTLIYRLDKITKETGFDIRNFKEATVFIIAFLVWKENLLI
ncbi:PucR family transcriptional regulator [Candidatus Clostridium stratigraminis]|uniref:PucR family transcriptional regulator n=1 Tax=Candidatus Clostridium stratigraminis TaxID=3381661 RepID=A0ABW8T8X5_9CLOT